MGKESKDYYEILGVGRGASAEEIKLAYRRLAKRHHPDTSGSEDAARFREIREAYETLGDPVRRLSYDRERGDAIPVHHVTTGASFGGRPPFEDVTAYPPWAVPRRARFRRRAMELVVPARAAARGARLVAEIPLDRPCPACDGTGRGFFLWCPDCDGRGRARVYRRVVFDIPAGVESGTLLRSRPGVDGTVVEARVVVTD